MLEGSIAALDAVERATGEPRVNVIGYCLGGTLLGATLGISRSQGATSGSLAPPSSPACWISRKPGEFGVFIDEEQVDNLEKQDERARLPRRLGDGVNVQPAARQRPGLVVRGEQLPDGQGSVPVRPALLELGLDAHAGRMHSFYLRNMYIKNLLAVPGGIELDRRADRPVQGEAAGLLHLDGRGSHRAVENDLQGRQVPWRAGRASCSAARATSPASSIRPRRSKYHYWTNEALPATPEQWFAGAEQTPGSWWNDWQAWIEQKNGGEKVPARVPGDDELKVIEDAPGSYAMVRLGAKPPRE